MTILVVTMASRYHWVNSGVDTQFNNAYPSLQPSGITLPANSVLKRIVMCLTSFNCANNGSGGNNAFPINMQMTAHFTSGPNNGRTIYETNRNIPFEPIIFVPITGSNVWCWWGAGDNECGFNHRCSYGSGPAGSTLQLTYSCYTNRFSSLSNFFGEWSFRFKALYFL